MASVRAQKGPEGGAVTAGEAPRLRPGRGAAPLAALDLGTVPTWLEADAPRVRCPEHGVVVASVPWARHGAGHTRGFDDMAAWLATHCGSRPWKS